MLSIYMQIMLTLQISPFVRLHTVYIVTYVIKTVYKKVRHLDSLVVEYWHRVWEVPGSIPSQGPRHTKQRYKNGTR